jgi:hypothetical protein
MSRRTPKQRAKNLENTLYWLRNKGKDDDGNNPTSEFRKLDSILPKKAGQPPENRAREVQGALVWMRNNGISPHDDYCVEKLNKLPSIPASRRTPEKRAKDLKNTLNWLRNKGKDYDANDPIGEFRKLDSMLPKK